MKRIETPLPDVSIFEPVVHGDRRGFLLESYNQRTFAKFAIHHVFVQDNHSRSQRGVLRGLHYQLGRPQAKLVRVIMGEVYDVAVDLRRGSPTFGKWTAVTLSTRNMRVFFIPEGFAHGFYVLSEHAEFCYKCSDYYAPQEEQGIVWNDPDLAIPWPLSGAEPILSAKDAAYGTLATRPQADLPIYRGSSL